MRKLICRLATILILVSPVQTTFAQATAPPSPQQPLGLDGLAALAQLAAAIQAIIDAIDALIGGFGGGGGGASDTPGDTNRDGFITDTEFEALSPEEQMRVVEALGKDPTDPNAPVTESSTTTDCQILRTKEFRVDGPFGLSSDSFSTIFIEVPFPRATVTAQELTAEDIVNGRKKCPFDGIRVAEITAPRPPLLVDNCTRRPDQGGLCQPNGNRKLSPGIEVQVRDSMQRAEPKSCRVSYGRVLESESQFCFASSVVKYAFNEGPLVPSPSGPLEVGIPQMTETKIIERIFIPSLDMFIRLAIIACSGGTDCINKALADFA